MKLGENDSCTAFGYLLKVTPTLIKHCVNKNLHKIIGGKGGHLPSHGGMHSSCTMKKEPILLLND